MNIIFAGTPDFSVPILESLHKEGYNIKMVITQQDRPKGRGKQMQPTPVKEKALELGLEVYQPKNINSRESLDKIKEVNPEVIVVVAYGQIFKTEILNLPKYGCINIHASILPKYRGAAPINWVLINGEKETGVTIMQMEEGLDSGDMYYMKKIDITPEDDAFTIHDKLSILGAEAIVESLDKIVKKEIKGEQQDHSLSTYAPMLSRDTGKIDWNKKNYEIVNLIRGVKGWPSATTYYGDEKIKIHQAKTIDEDFSDIPGEIIRVDDEGVLVQTGKGSILIEKLQFPNKRKMHVSEYIQGNEIKEKIVLSN
ncbi:MAG TPA: methionyl-tRNA formyltransferase [Tissierellaceae bacterium]